MKELMDAIEKVYEHDKTDTILPTISLAAAYITNGKKKVAIKVIEKSDIIISQTNEESMKVLEGLFHSISKDPNSADVLQDIIEVTQQMIPQELHIRLNLILAKFYAAQEMFDKSTTLLENCYKKSSDVILEKCGDIIGHIKQQFEMKNEPLPEKLRQSEESENIENLCKTFPRMSGLEAYHWIKDRVDEENTDILIELIKKLVDRDEVPVDLIFIMGRVLKRKGRPDVIISLSDMLSDIFPREFKEGFRRNIPFAYYNDRNVLNYIDQVQYNDYRVDSCEISPELLVFLAEKGSIGFEKFLSLAEDENCLHQAAVCNALFCYYLNSDIEQAEFYFRKIPETWTLSHLKFALTQVFTSAKPENIDLFWDLVENRLIKQDYIKNRIISFYLTQKMLGKALNHFYDAVEKNITVYAKNAQFILFLCEKTGTNVPEEVMLIIENASLEPNLVAEQQNLDAEQPDLDAEHLDLDAEQPNLDAEHLDLDAEQKNLDAEQLDLDAEQSNLDAEQKNLDTEQLDLDAEQSNLDAELPDLDAEQPNLDAEHLDLDAEQKNLDAEQLDLDAEQSNLDAKQPDLDAEWTNLDAEHPNLDAEQPDLDAELKDLDAEQPYLDAKRKSLDAKHPYLDVEQPYLDAKRKSLDAKHPYLDAKRKSLDAKHPYLDVEQPYLDARKKGLDAEEKKKRKLKYL
ncbi:hypothetical protein KUTeg_016590 [Tegillarca granosa]|uniref:Clathrin heavy chain n=1 Tax=Tegillarca granosa TaxID=220873 RepID=A0ABQ9ERK8_TEGGR|nr:hypothetical protein KUTeg_016590 [Tegillarca granosa]